MTPEAPPASSGASLPKIGGGVALLVLLNYVFNELMDDSGLHCTMLTAPLKEYRSNATARADFRARAELAGMLGVVTREDLSESGALRFELLEERRDDHKEDRPWLFTAVMVHWRRPEAVRLPSWLSSELKSVQVTQHLTTVFPERSRWREAVPHPEPGELGELGHVALLVQQTTWTLVNAETADAFRRGWPDLGYNALGEAGVLRCDLFAVEEAVDGDGGGETSMTPKRLVSRKVFRDASALAAHEASEHYIHWRKGAEGTFSSQETTLYDTLLPRTSAFPFRSRWATA